MDKHLHPGTILFLALFHVLVVLDGATLVSSSSSSSTGTGTGTGSAQ